MLNIRVDGCMGLEVGDIRDDGCMELEAGVKHHCLGLHGVRSGCLTVLRVAWG